MKAKIKLKMTTSRNRLLWAVQRFVQAEWEFRLGPHAYSDLMTEAYVAALDELRYVATGTRKLHKAAKRLGKRPLPTLESLFEPAPKIERRRINESKQRSLFDRILRSGRYKP